MAVFCSRLTRIRIMAIGTPIQYPGVNRSRHFLLTFWICLSILLQCIWKCVAACTLHHAIIQEDEPGLGGLSVATGTLNLGVIAVLLKRVCFLVGCYSLVALLLLLVRIAAHLHKRLPCFAQPALAPCLILIPRQLPVC